MSIGLRTLVLNGDFNVTNLLKLEPIPAEDAMIRVLNETCVVVDTYDRVIKTHKVENRVPWPSVIARKEYTPRPENVALSPYNLLVRDGYECVYCGLPLNENTLTMDHYYPKSMGGPMAWENILASCGRCNHTLGDTHPKDKRPKHKPYEPSYMKLVSLRKRFPVTVDHESWVPWLGKWHSEIIVRNNGSEN